MRGNVIGFDPDTNTGAISGHDGRRYDFATQDWHGHGTPHRGDLVDFTLTDSRATQIFLLEPEYVRPGFWTFYFSPAGRISRSQYWLRAVLPIWVIAVAGLILIWIAAALSAHVVVGILTFVLAIYWLAVIWPGFATHVKRIHDRNKPGWLILIPLISASLIGFLWAVALSAAITAAITGRPHAAAGVLAGAGAFSIVLYVVQFAISLWFFIEFGCMRGTLGANRYGPDPVPQR